MNDGEKQELLIKIYLTYLRDNKINTEQFGIITNLGFNNEYKKISDKNIDFSKIENDPKMIIKIAEQLEIQKSNPGDKADVKINKISYSLKCVGFSNPAIVNHTNRDGWLKIAERKEFNIEELDKIIDQYWILRERKKIKEDCSNKNQLSPFKDKIKILKPFLDYFLFEGSGKANSLNPADKIFEFEKYNLLSSWKIYGTEYLEQHWNNLVFSIRSKGMPPKYVSHKNKKFIEPWTRNFKGEKGEKKFRGSLHVRVG